MISDLGKGCYQIQETIRIIFLLMGVKYPLNKQILLHCDLKTIVNVIKDIRYRYC